MLQQTFHTQHTQARKKEERGKFLTTLLVLDSFLFFPSIIYLPYKIFMIVFLHEKVIWWYTLFSLLSTLIGIIIVIGLWQWKKAAVYAHFLHLSIIFTVIMIPFFALFPQYDYGWIVLGPLLVLGVWFWAIKRKWRQFV